MARSKFYPHESTLFQYRLKYADLPTHIQADIDAWKAAKEKKGYHAEYVPTSEAIANKIEAFQNFAKSQILPPQSVETSEPTPAQEEAEILNTESVSNISSSEVDITTPNYSLLEAKIDTLYKYAGVEVSYNDLVKFGIPGLFSEFEKYGGYKGKYYSLIRIARYPKFMYKIVTNP
ncbi:hypothetical protein [Hugenholtzia roseola]|uniref:hypothetical protein n=1 Tax=Hugenholtzia roseola TaxID=1002 RepID=UPI0012B62D6B|nr:hypothetical protein [Hugenholtzia roseola]